MLMMKPYISYGETLFTKRNVQGVGVVGGGYKNIFFTNNIQYSKKQISILGLESPHSGSAYIN